MAEVISITPLMVGDEAPFFSGPDQNGKLHTSESMIGKKYALFFYPNDDTETCTKEACNLRDNYTLLAKRKIAIIGVSHASIISKKKFSDKYQLPYPIIADEDYKIVNAFGVYGEKLFMGKTILTIHRITFVIDELGRIEKIIHKVNSAKAASQILG